MDNRNKDRIVHKLLEIAKDAEAFLSSDENQPYFPDSLLASYYDEEIDTIVQNLLEEDVYASKFSEEFLEKLLKEKVRNMIRSIRQRELPSVLLQTIATETTKTVFDELDSYTTKQIIYLPVSGIILELEEEKLEIGKITFLKMTQERIDEVIEHMTSAVMALQNTLEYKQGFIKAFTEDLQQIFNDTENQVFAVYQVVAEPIRARERAVRECYQVFDVLRYAIPMLTNIYPMDFSIPIQDFDDALAETTEYVQRDRRVKIEPDRFISFGLRGEVGTNTTRHIVTLRDSPGFSHETDRKERFLPLKLHAQAIEVMNRIQVNEVSKILKKEENGRTNFETTILRSIHWFASAQTPMLPEYLLLSLMSSIEAFLNPRRREGVTTAVCEGVAALGEEQGYTYIWKRMKELYGKRSILTHGDQADIMERDISELRAIAFSLIHLMIQRRDTYVSQHALYTQVKRKREEVKQRIANR